jgi:hypothetical protein
MDPPNALCVKPVIFESAECHTGSDRLTFYRHSFSLLADIDSADLWRRVARVWGEDAKAGELIPVPLSDDAIAVLQDCLGSIRRTSSRTRRSVREARSSGAGRSRADRTTPGSGRPVCAPACPSCAGTTFGTPGRRGMRRQALRPSCFRLLAAGRTRGWCEPTHTLLRSTYWTTRMRSGFRALRYPRVQIRPQWRWRTMGKMSKFLMLLGWTMGFEPTTTGITIRDSTVELRPPRRKLSSGLWPARQDSNL